MSVDGRRLSREWLETARFASVELSKRGVGVDAIAKSMQVGWRTVYKWLKIAVRNGKQALRRRKAPGASSRLSQIQFTRLKKFLRKSAKSFGYSSELWTGPRLHDLIKREFKIKYNKRYIPELLRKLGLVLKFPERRALEQDISAVKQWKKDRLPEILEFSRKKRGFVFYADEALVSLIPYVGKTWAFPKCKPIVRVSGKRGEHIGISAAVNRQGRICFELTREKERFTAKTFLRFVRKLRRQFPYRHLTLIIDGAPIHKAKLVKLFAEDNRSWLRVEILPAYSPELNPSEKPWRYVKTKKLNAAAIATKAELRKQTAKIFAALKRKPRIVSSFFK
jgi:transposase